VVQAVHMEVEAVVAVAVAVADSRESALAVFVVAAVEWVAAAEVVVVEERTLVVAAAAVQRSWKCRQHKLVEQLRLQRGVVAVAVVVAAAHTRDWQYKHCWEWRTREEHRIAVAERTADVTADAAGCN